MQLPWWRMLPKEYQSGKACAATSETGIAMARGCASMIRCGLRCDGQPDDMGIRRVDAGTAKSSRRQPYQSHVASKAKFVKGHKRYLLVDITGLLMAVFVTAAAVHDRDGARLLLARLGSSIPPRPASSCISSYACIPSFLHRRRMRSWPLGPLQCVYNEMDIPCEC
jgi:hypothetical protein